MTLKSYKCAIISNCICLKQNGLVVINRAFPGSTLGPEIVCELSFSRSQPDSEGFSPGSPVFLPQQKSTPSLAVVLCTEVEPRLLQFSLRLRVRAFSRSGVNFQKNLQDSIQISETPKEKFGCSFQVNGYRSRMT